MGFYMHLLLRFNMVLSLLCLDVITAAHYVPTLQATCLDHERSALLRFKQSFRTDCTGFDNLQSPKMDSWMGRLNANCCTWDGVKCDVTTGNVIELNLTSSCIRGTFPSNSSLFSLTHLQYLDLSSNDFNLSRIPSKISILRSLEFLQLSGSSFCCQIPSGISKLSNLSFLELSFNYLSGPIPPSLGNLTKLSQLYLSNINLTGNFVPGKFSSWLPKLQNNLEALELTNMMLPSDEMPSLLANFTNLKALLLNNTHLTGPFPPEFANLTQLKYLYLANNNLKGLIPQWVSGFTNLEMLDLSVNNLSGNFHTFSNLKGLRSLYLDRVKLTFPPYSKTNTTLFKLHDLSLGGCNLTEFPQFLRDQDELKLLVLKYNKIEGKIPQWFSDITKESLLYLLLNMNFLTGFERPLKVLPWTRLKLLVLADNKFQGKLPSLPSSLEFCRFSNNLLTGFNPSLFCNARSLFFLDLSFNRICGQISLHCKGHQFVGSLQVLNLQNNYLSGVIPKKICNATSMISLDLSNNNMSGRVPTCIGNQLGNSLQILNLQNNYFVGKFLPTFTRLCKLKMISLSHNRLEGQLPRSLVNCTMLEALDMGNNHFNDSFPSWLGSLPALHVLALCSNEFHGNISDPISTLDFRHLRIMDLSSNKLVGNLPYRYIQIMHAMRDSHVDITGSYNISYFETLHIGAIDFYPRQSFIYSIKITNKGNELLYPKISKAFRVIDFSRNYFTGMIPEIIGDLKGLQVLNLSNNNLQGEIPSSLANLTNLESLDLSHNKLSGPIPRQLSQATFLEVFNVSYNDLVGPLPQGRQFDSFDHTSYKGNPGLCGSPLSKKCQKADSSPPLLPMASDEDSSEDPDLIDWVIRSLGCLSGCIIGFIIGKLFITDKYHGWFLETFGRQRLQRRVQRAPRH